jgi:hypothetical protein
MATLAAPASSFHKLGSDEPRFFANRVQIALQLQYRINAAGSYEFSYRTAATPALWSAAALSREAEGKAWLPYQEREQFEDSLDIRIPGQDTLVHVETVGPHFFWSLTKDAITMLDDHSDLYGELLYLEGNRWVRREEFTGHFCRQIRFKAKFNSAATQAESHKFSYNVLLRDRFGDMEEYEIDPDIQNPRV